MAHIASCLASPQLLSTPSFPPSPVQAPIPSSSPEKAFRWRLLPQEQRKYQLFPKDKPLPALNFSKTIDPERALAAAMHDRTEKSLPVPTLRLRVGQHGLIRRRKISVPDLEPMTTVQEVAMDSPTIPGRPPLHERSASAPEDSREERLRFPLMGTCDDLTLANLNDGELTPADWLRPPPSLAARHLAPLVIPKSEAPLPLLQMKPPTAKGRSDSTPPVTGGRRGRMEVSPLSHARATPSSSTPDLLYPRSANTDVTSTATLPTPVSASVTEAQRASPYGWDSLSAISSQSERLPVTQDQDAHKIALLRGHRRGASESSTMMDRGRPRKRIDVRNNNGTVLRGPDGSIVSFGNTSNPKRTKSAERRAFEELPKGWLPSQAVDSLGAINAAKIQKQALGQAERFEVLKIEDVEALSKELRHLDERTDYLRRTYTSLRAGRRNLHSRICQYLRSPRVAKFSHESMLKQEEALAELDASIDDWVTKLEQAENRRTRVRQKLLEHVAAAAILRLGGGGGGNEEPAAQSSPRAAGGQVSSHLSTPPRSPSKESFPTRTGSPSSPQPVVAQVPSTVLEQSVVEAAGADNSLSRATSAATAKRGDVESIRIYAGDDVYALLADVENEISKMGRCEPEPTPEGESFARTRTSRREPQRSHEQLSARRADSQPPAANTVETRSTSTGAAAIVVSGESPSPLTPHTGGAKETLLLTSAVFKP